MVTIQNYPPYMSNPEGYREAKITAVYKAGSHTGLDTVVNRSASTVLACAIFDGTVTSNAWSIGNGWVFDYTSNNGRVMVRYMHLKEQPSFAVGAKISKNQTVGEQGMTGTNAKGVHLHTTIHIDGKEVDPQPYLDGTKQLPIDTKEDLILVRKVTAADLNLRKGAGTTYDSYGFIPVGTLLNIVETTTISNGDTWGKHTCVMADGKEYTGWSNIGSTWSAEYTGPLDLAEAGSGQIVKGSKVKVREKATDYDGKSLISFVYATVFDVMSISGDRVVIGLNGTVTAAVKMSDLILQ